VILVGIDDTDGVGTPGTNQLARAILARLGLDAAGAIVCRHQLFFDPRVPYTSKNGSASIQLPALPAEGAAVLAEPVRAVMRAWFVEGSDPGLAIATSVSPAMSEFAERVKTEVVTQEEARAVARAGGCHLESLGGTGQGVIGALAAVALAAGGGDGRVVHRDGWPWPDGLAGVQPVTALFERGVAEIREAASGRPFPGLVVDVGKHLRPSWRDHRVVVLVEPGERPEDAWRAVKVP
jgi:hypothetical protein